MFDRFEGGEGRQSGLPHAILERCLVKLARLAGRGEEILQRKLITWNCTIARKEMTRFGRRVCPVDRANMKRKSMLLLVLEIEKGKRSAINEASDKHQQSVSFLISYSNTCLDWLWGRGTYHYKEPQTRHLLVNELLNTYSNRVQRTINTTHAWCLLFFDRVASACSQKKRVLRHFRSLVT